MSTATRALVRPRSGASVSTRLVEFASRTSVHLALVVISVIWLVPTFGLLVTSFRTRSDILSTGWWNAFIEWRFTPENYLRVLSSSGATDSLGLNFLNSIIITVPSTFLPVLVASLAAYAFAWLQFRWRDTIFMVIVALLIVP
ncbi:MAG TPA: carbohydrate ABC transporter permease, partial [Anaerolineae bacterium]